jgi:2-hydroxychromene-2-carboxylate isomerase
MNSPAKARWYFDLVSPFAYLHLKEFNTLPGEVDIEYVPILLAALLSHWGHKGPAEIPAKRIYTYRYVNWLARHLGIELRMPPSHPFNSLHAMRLLIAAGLTGANVTLAFDFVFRNGRDLQDPAVLVELGRQLGIRDVKTATGDEKVKQILRANTDQAIKLGVFGVPTFVVDDALFWGADSIDMMRDYLREPDMFMSPEMQRIDSLPVGAIRKDAHVPVE